jgi:signal peptidase I
MMEENDKRAHDSRIILYRSFRLIVIITFAAVFLKSCVIDCVVIKGNQMTPTLVSGDRTLIFRFPYLSFISAFFKPSLAKPVVFDSPLEKNRRASLRIAGIWGDTVSIDSGVIVNSQKPQFKFSGKEKGGLLVPATFSPRDFFPPYQIPKKGTQLILDSLSLRDFFFAVNVVRQENKKCKITIKADLYVDDSLSNDYFIKEFALYKGTIDTIPSKYQFDWFFWDRLNQYLFATVEERTAVIKFSLFIDNAKTAKYSVQDNYVFLLADNWSDGLDSRYIGPVQLSSLVGRVFFVLWSYDKNSEKHLKVNRFGKIVR